MKDIERFVVGACEDITQIRYSTDLRPEKFIGHDTYTNYSKGKYDQIVDQKNYLHVYFFKANI